MLEMTLVIIGALFVWLAIDGVNDRLCNKTRNGQRTE